MPFKVVHAEADHDAALPIERAVLAAAGAELVCAGTTDPHTIIAVAHDAEILLTEVTTITRHILEGLASCRAVVCYTIGLDHIDLHAATELGIIIANTPGFCAEEVSNHAIMFMLACARRLLPLDRGARAGTWPAGRNLEAALLPMGSLHGERLGLVSFGGIARLVAHKAAAFGLQVSAYDPWLDAAVLADHGVAPVGLDELLETSDYVSIHAPLLPATRHMIGTAQLRRMKPSAYLINTSRGAIVDEAALVYALAERWIAGAALDVFEAEPPPIDHPLLQLDNVIVTPHTAFCSAAAYKHVRQQAAAEAVRVLRGDWPAALANPQVKNHSRMKRQGGQA